MKKGRNNAPARPQAQVHRIAPQGQVQVQSAMFKGPLPPPALLREYNEIVPGAAQTLIERAEKEADHRHKQEDMALKSNISAQARHQDIVEVQSKAVFKSDLIGQCLGFIVCAACTSGAFYLALNGNNVGATALAAIPTAAVLQAFRVAGIKKESQEKK